ncbi:hypothetical protein DPMN_012273 [Dreissena polymorpha]|uniref:Uncharacterized protein n=1 Tax=Dreissena polymorpha TaxID=45954 RepID=A0A9D4S163_DREPO|nr:hypothetical protein DPMN_012273 [Dreissena polymorpha]
MIFERDGLKNFFIMNNSDGQPRVTNAKRLLETLIPTCRTLPGSDAGIDTVSAGGVTVYRGSAGTLSAITGALPATTGAMPGRCRLSPGHYRRQPGLCRAVDRFQPGRHREIV